MPFVHMLAALLVVAIWGGNFVSAKFGMIHFPPFLLTALRFALVAAVLLPFVKIPRGKMKEVFVLSFLLGTGHFAFIIGGIYQGLDIPTAAIGGQMGVPFSCLLSTYFFRDKLGWWRSLGMAVAFLGIVLIAGTPQVVEHFGAFILVLIAAFFWAASNIYSKFAGKIPVLSLLAWMSLFCFPQVLLISFFVEDRQMTLLRSIDLTSMLSITYSALLSSIVAYGLWYKLLSKYPVSQVAPYSLLAPLFSVIFGQMFFPVEFSWRAIIGGILTLVGVAIIVVRRPRLAEAGE